MSLFLFKFKFTIQWYIRLKENSSFFYRSYQLECIENICSSDWFRNNYFSFSLNEFQKPNIEIVKKLFPLQFSTLSINSAVKILKRHTFLSFSFITRPQKCVWSIFFLDSKTTLTSQPIMVTGIGNIHFHMSSEIKFKTTIFTS